MTTKTSLMEALQLHAKTSTALVEAAIQALADEDTSPQPIAEGPRVENPKPVDQEFNSKVSNVPTIVAGILPNTNSPGVKLHMPNAQAVGPYTINEAGPTSNVQVPRGYCMVEVISRETEGQFAGFDMTEHGGATLLADSNGQAKYVLGCAHVPTVVNDDGTFSSIANQYRITVGNNSRAQRELVFDCNEVYVHPWYEGQTGVYRWDMSLSVLPEPVDISYAISRHDMSMHKVDAGEELMYCGFGSTEKHGPIHDTIHFGRMKATNTSKDQITELDYLDDQFEQGFSGGPFYSTKQSMAWSGITSHYVELGGDKRKSYIIPPTVALPWADAMITYLMERDSQ